MSVRPVRFLARLVWLSHLQLALIIAPVWSQSAADTGRDGLLPVPVPDAGRLEPGAQKQLQQAQASLEGLLAGSQVTSVELAETYGLLGKLYYVYDFGDLAQICFHNALQLQPDDYRWHYYLAVMQRLDAAWQEAANSLIRVLELRADDVPSLIRLGEAQLELGSVDEASRIYSRVIELAPEIAAGYAGRGRLAYERGDYQQAIADLSKALELQPKANSLHHRLGMAYRQAGDLENARFHLQSNKGAYLRFPDPLISNLASLVQSSQVYLNAGIAAARQQNWPVALRQFRLAVEDQPEDSLAAYNLGLALLQTGDRDAGIDWVRKAVELDPDSRNAHINLATLMAEQGRWEETVHHLQEAHRVDPEEREIHLELATALAQLGRNREAIGELEALLEIHPRDTEALLNVGTLLVQEGRQTAAIEAFVRLLEAGGDPKIQVVAHLQLGLLLEESGRAAEALTHFESAVEVSPYSAEAQSVLATALGRNGRFSEAAERYTQVVALAPDRLDAHFGRAMALILAERYPDALAALEESLGYHKENVALTHALARLLATCPDVEIRDGQRAVTLADSVLRSGFSFEHAETLAMALAEMGRFDEAVNLQSRIVAEAQRLGEMDVAARAERRLAAYQRGEPLRAPWKGN